MGFLMLTPAELVWLMAAVAKGDQAAFERLYVATRAKLYGVALRILRRSDLADEVIQETYLKIWNNAGTFDPKLATPITWMVAIARNRALDADERAQADALLLLDPEFTAEVRRWERKLGELNVLVAPVEPPALVWERITAGLPEAGPREPMRLPDVAVPAAGAAGADIID